MRTKLTSRVFQNSAANFLNFKVLWALVRGNRIFWVRPQQMKFFCELSMPSLEIHCDDVMRLINHAAAFLTMLHSWSSRPDIGGMLFGANLTSWEHDKSAHIAKKFRKWKRLIQFRKIRWRVWGDGGLLLKFITTQIRKMFIKFPKHK